jgi:hypothetical protein
MALDEEVPGAVTQCDDCVRLGGYPDKHPVPDELQVAADRIADYAAGRLHVSRKLRARWPGLQHRRRILHFDRLRQVIAMLAITCGSWMEVAVWWMK